jgi:hypothetical protein
MKELSIGKILAAAACKPTCSSERTAQQLSFSILPSPMQHPIETEILFSLLYWQSLQPCVASLYVSWVAWPLNNYAFSTAIPKEMPIPVSNFR